MMKIQIMKQSHPGAFPGEGEDLFVKWIVPQVVQRCAPIFSGPDSGLGLESGNDLLVDRLPAQAQDSEVTSRL